MDDIAWDSSSETNSGDDSIKRWSADALSSSETSLENSAFFYGEEANEYASYPSMSTSVDCKPLDGVIECDLAWPQLREDKLPLQDSNKSTTLIYAAWALLSSRMINAERVGFDITHSQTRSRDEQSIWSLLLDFNPRQLVREYLLAVRARAAISKIRNGKSNGESRFSTLLSTGSSDPEAHGDNHGDNHPEAGKRYSLVLEFHLQQSRLQVKARYDPQTIEGWLLSRLLVDFECYIQSLHRGSDTFLGELKTISTHDLEKIWQWNGELPVATERCMQDLFQDQAVLQPDALAIDAWDGQLTYSKLDHLSEQLASHLVVLGVKPGIVVPLCIEKSMWMPVAMMGVLKAGGAFCLLEPSLPEQRLRTIVEEVDASLMLSSFANMSLSSQLLQTVVQVDLATIDSFVGSPPRPGSQSPSSAMFAVFTSGSTGKPKGAILTHTNYASAFTHQLKLLGFTRESRVFDFASYSFDVSIHNVFSTLTTGACLCIPSEQDRRNNITKTMADMRVTLAHLTPSVTRLIDPDNVPSLKTMVFTGEPLPLDEAKRWWGKVHIVNEYGPAECTINTVNDNPSSAEDATGIGSLRGAAGWLVDPENHDSLVSIGCVGELLVEGPLVGRGYINDEAKTAASFIENPEWLLQGGPGHPGRSGRLYKTGDLVKYNEHGSLRIIGRKDVQVKIRGQRVDLGEVEHWIHCCIPQVERVVAEMVIPQGPDPNPTLVAFIQSQDAATKDLDDVQVGPVPMEVQEKLAQHLPSYVVPTVFFWMQKLPLSPTGKLNRKGLREIGSTFSVDELAEARGIGRQSGPKRQPSSEMELRFRDLWAQALGMQAHGIGLDDNFFQLGGDSITSMKVVSEARKMGVQVTVADLFRQPSLFELAQHCHHLLDSIPGQIAPFALLGDNLDQKDFVQSMARQNSLDSMIIEDAYPCTRLQEGLMFLTTRRPGDYLEQSVLELAPDVDVERLRKAWERVVKAEAILRTRLIQHSDLGLLQVIMSEGVHWEETSGLEEHLAFDRRRSMQLGDALSRIALVRDDSGNAKHLVWTLHHSIYDGWSINLVTDAVVRAYLGGEIRSGPPFQHFIKYVQDQDDQRAADYWRTYLQEFDAPLLLSSEQPIADSVARHTIPNPGNNKFGITTSTLIRAAWALVVGQMVGKDDVVFGSTLYGRNAAVTGLDEMVAPTIATVPVRVRFNTKQAVSEYLETIQQEAVEMMPYEQTGMQKIALVSQDAQQACQLQTHLVIQPEDSSQGKSILGQWRSGGQEQFFSTYALTLEIWLGANEISASAMFDSRMIPSWTVPKLLQRLEWVMHQLNDADDRHLLSEVEVSTRDDLEQIWQWNEHVPERVDQCVHDLLADQVKARSQSPAVCAWDGDLTYRELDGLSNKLAQHLCRLGVMSANSLVPLCFDKSMWTTVAMLGVLKANAGFVLLDPNLPQQRLESIVRQAASELIITGSSQEILSSRLAPKTITLSQDFFSQLIVGAATPLPQVNPSSIAYAVFTSGSTGTPKGVMISHANGVSAQHHQYKLMGHTPESRLLDFASYSFDVAVSNIFSVLTCGGCLCVPSDDDRKNRLEESIISMGVTALDLTPSTLQVLSPERLPNVRLVTLGGEALRSSDVKNWCGKVRVCNAYGPSECTPTCTINYDIHDPKDASHIGKGAGALTWIVNPGNHDELLPPGCTGELLLEGPVVGMGYLNDSIKTNASFIKDPSWLLQGSSSRVGRHGRLYKTGDLVRYREDGSLVFVGRKDTQVKIRGQRVEPGEIEAVLLGEELVKDAVVVVQKPEGQEASLAGFVTLCQGSSSAQHSNTDEREGQQKVQSWEDQFDETYSSISTTQTELVGRDFIGWSSMYDGVEIDKNEMNEWLDDTVNTIVNGKSVGNVLEIGSGSGMILFNLTRYGLQQYVGIEPSAPAVEFSSKMASTIPALQGKDQVALLKGTAEDIRKLDVQTTTLNRPVSPELVIINSVAQYFPSQDYLFNIIQELVARDTVQTVFLGDIRSFALHREFLARRTLHIANKEASLEEFGNILENLERVEPELLLDPCFFTGLPARLSGIRHVEILPKRMEATNELSAYRYAAVLHTSSAPSSKDAEQVREVTPNKWIDFSSEGLDRSLLAELLAIRSAGQETVAMANIPNSKSAYEKAIVHALDATKNGQAAQSEWLSQAKEASQSLPSLSAHDLHQMAKQAGYQVEISWARQHSQSGGLDAIFHKQADQTSRTLFRFPTDHANRPLKSLSSHPLSNKQDEQGRISERLLTMLQARLPSYTIPSTLTILDEIPLTNNGKVDRSSLAKQIKDKESSAMNKRQPSTEAEKALQEIWSNVLNLDTEVIGLDDGFIQLGGTSLDAMKVVKLAREAGIKLEVSDMFRHSTTSIERLLENSGQEAVGDTPEEQQSGADCLMAAIERHDSQITTVQLETKKTQPVVSIDQQLTVLLTGANGFIGTQILRQLLEHGRVRKVIALVRGSQAGAARERVISAATKAQWWTPFHADALEVWNGDLASPNQLGLDDTHWKVLTDGFVDVMIHNAASVHFMKSYEALEAANVGSTAQMLKLVAQTANMRFVYVSSARHQDPKEEKEREAAEVLAANPNGYNETKFVSESLVKRAAARQQDKFTVVSPGLVIGTPAEGVANADDWIWRTAAASIRVGMFNSDETENWMPVSDAAACATTILEAAMAPAALEVVTQVKGGMTMGEFWSTLQSTGYSLRGASAQEWISAVRNDIQNDPEKHPFGALSGMLEELGNTTQEQWAENWYRSSLSSPARLKAALAKSAEFLRKTGFLPSAEGTNGVKEVALSAFTRSGV